MSASSYYEEAFKLYEENLRLAREQGNKGGMATALHYLGTLHLNRGGYQEATSAFEKSLEISGELGDKVGIRANLRQLAASQRAVGNYKEALSYTARALLYLGGEPAIPA